MREKSAPTLSDVAERAGVNKVTASVVLSGARANTRVSPATRERILRAAADLRYQPNAVARSLRRKRTDVIGVYSSYGYVNARNRFFAEILGGLQYGCDDHGKDLLLHGAFRGRSPDDVYRELADGRIDGLVLLTRPEDRLVELLAASALPVVAITDAVSALPSVVADDAGGSRLVAEHLASRGHRHVLYRATPRMPVSARRRLEGFRRAASGLGLTVTCGHDPDDQGTLGEDARAYLAAPPGERPTAVVCWNDFLALRTFEYAQNAGLRVPEEIAVAGFDGIPMLERPARRLTTVHAPWPEVARTAVALLVRQIAGEKVAQETVLSVDLIVGDTT